jgi:hypothetical protein
VFDRDWNLKFDEAVTNFTLADDHKGGRPWVILHGNRLYVSYDVDTVNKTTEEEEKKWQAHVSIYEITPSTDLNRDGTVNILDIFIVAKAFGAKPGDQNWSATADVDKNGQINILDIFMIAWEYGKVI